MSGHNHRAPCCEQPVREAIQRRIAWPAGGVDPRRSAELECILLVEDVARQRDEHRSGRRGHRDFRRAVHDERQVLQPGDLHRPLHERLRDRYERVVEHRLGESVPLLLLTGGDDDRRSHPLRVVERAHGVAEPRCDMNVAGAEVAGRARVAVRHRDHQRFLQRHHVCDRPAGRAAAGHDRKLGGAGIPEQMRHPLALEQREEGFTAEDGVHGVPPIVRSSTQFANECTTGSCTESRPDTAAADSRPACWRSEIALSSGIDLSHRL